MQARGFATHYVDATTEDLRAIEPGEADLVVVLGGPIGAYEEAIYPFLVDELGLIERRLAAAGRSSASASAPSLWRARWCASLCQRREGIGWSPLTLTDAGEHSPLRHLAGAAVLHWHGDTFDLPDGAVHLASTPLCRNQAFSRGKSALGLQFTSRPADRNSNAGWSGTQSSSLTPVCRSLPCAKRPLSSRRPARSARVNASPNGSINWNDSATAPVRVSAIG